MFLLDTNVVSEVMRPLPSEHVIHWLDQHTSDGLWISSITIAEIHYGLNILPDGQIAAIAQTHGLALATRNTTDFEQCDIALINPFE